MKALAELLIDLGWSITGSDAKPSSSIMESMEKRGLHIHRGHDNCRLSTETDVLIYSPAIPADNPERQLATKLEISQRSYSEMLGQLMQERVGVCVAGTHGKSTTSALTGYILGEASTQASAVFGAELCKYNVGGWAGTGETLVAESCEYQKSFLDLTPKHAAILGIEPDHFDCYPNSEGLQNAFAQFAAKVESDGVLLVNGSCQQSKIAAKSALARVETFSRHSNSDWWIDSPRKTSLGTRARVFYHGNFFAEITLNLAGKHNLNNALASVALSHHAGATVDEIREGVQNFPGIKRRFESVGSWRGMTLIDDYAHHPTAVQAVLRTARELYPRRRIWCIFQPHQISRTEVLMEEFSQSFGFADEILIAPVFTAREADAVRAGNLSEEMANRIGSLDLAARYRSSLDQIISTLDDEARAGDILITMGAGDINRVHHEFTRRLQRHNSAG